MDKEKEPERTVELPCYVTLLQALDEKRERVLVELHFPEQKIPAFVKKEDLIMEIEPVRGYGFEGLVKVSVIGEDEENLQVKIKEGFPHQTFRIPKE